MKVGQHNMDEIELKYSDNIIKFIADNNNDNSIGLLAEYLRRRESRLSEMEIQVAPRLLYHFNPEVRYNFIKYIGRVKDHSLAQTLSTVINNDKEKYYIQLEAISTLKKLSDNDENIREILKKAVIRLSTSKWQDKVLAKNLPFKDVFELLNNSLKEILLSQFNIKAVNIQTKQTHKYYVKEDFTFSCFITGDLKGSMILNISRKTAADFIEICRKIGLSPKYNDEVNDILMYHSLYPAFNLINEAISENFKNKHNISMEFLPSSFFNKNNIVLSEKEDDAYEIELETEIGVINIGFIRYSEQSYTQDVNEIIDNLKIFIENNRIVVICKAVKFYLECSYINDSAFTVVDNRVIMNKASFKKALNYFNALSNECKTDRRSSSQFDYKIRFLGYICDEMDLISQNYIFFKIEQVNIELRERIFHYITTYKTILRLNCELSQKVILQLNYNDLLHILQHSNTAVRTKIISNCSQKMRATLRDSLNQRILFHPASVFESKIKMGRIIKQMLSDEDECSKNISILLEKTREVVGKF